MGDSLTDIEAAQAVGIRAIGYANEAGKRAKMVERGADAVVECFAGLVSF